MTAPQMALLPDGKRLHLNHGPIDLIIEAFGEDDERHAAYVQATARFQTILEELVAELPALRRPSGREPHDFAGVVARRMGEAVSRHAGVFVTPMAAVAGAVADEMLEALVVGRRLDRAYVNNGGDCVIDLSAGQEMKLAIGGTGHGFADRVMINAASPVRGIATSGWRGRSFSLGIADAVTVLARTGAEADVAATLIANSVDLPGHAAIRRQPANELQLDTDLGGRLVTVYVGPLTASECRKALARGCAVADDLQRRGLIEAAALFLGGESRICGSSAFEFCRAPLCPAGHLPHGWGDQLAHLPSQNAKVAEKGETSPQPISTLVGEMPGKAEGGNVGHLLPREEN